MEEENNGESENFCYKQVCEEIQCEKRDPMAVKRDTRALTGGKIHQARMRVKPQTETKR